MKGTEQIQQFLADLGRHDLSLLVLGAAYDIVEDLTSFIPQPVVLLQCPVECAEAIKGLPPFDSERLLEAFKAAEPTVGQGGFTQPVVLRPTANSDIHATREQIILSDLLAERNMLIDVSTGGAMINSVNDYYRARRKRLIRAFAERGLDDPNEFPSLWDWYSRWRSEFDNYAERREYVNNLYDPLIEQVLGAEAAALPSPEPTGWARVDSGVESAKDQLRRATQEEHFQAIGLFCREILISVAQEVFDPETHPIEDDVELSTTDAKRMLLSYFGAELPGSSNEEARGHAKAALRLALRLQHDRTADFRIAAMCVEAATTVITLCAILSGRHDPGEPR